MSKKLYLEYCEVFSSELQSISFPKSYMAIGDDAFMMENVVLKTEIRTLLLQLTLVCYAQKQLGLTLKELNHAEELVWNLDDVRDDVQQENNALNQLRRVEDDISHSMVGTTSLSN